MGLLETFFGRGRDTAAGLSEGEAALGLLVAAMVADGEVRPEERESLARAVEAMGLFPGEAAEGLGPRIANLAQLCERYGPRALRDLASHLPESRRAEVYGRCVEVAVADGRVVGEEYRFMGRLREALGIQSMVADQLLARATSRLIMERESGSVPLPPEAGPSA